MSTGRKTVTRYGTKPTAKGTPPKAKKNSLPIGWLAAGAVAVALVVAIVMSMSSEDTGPLPEQFGQPAVAGQALAAYDSAAIDSMVGLPSPEVSGADFDGTPVAISNDGTPKAILFLAHWCSHCQNEVPAVQSWLDSGGLPSGVELISVATSTSTVRENYPPSRWLDREGWTPAVIVDDELSSVGTAFGLTAFPYWVFVDADGNISGRWSGGLPTESLDLIIADLVG